MKSINKIPIIVDLMGAHWQQPSVDEILVSDTQATMSMKAFVQILQHDHGYPSGFYEGKMWKSRHIRNIGQDTYEADYYLHWFSQNRLGNWQVNNRLIVIFDWKLLLGIQDEPPK